MKIAFLSILSLFAISSFAVSEGVDAPGHVFYKMKDGALVKRDVSLFVPSKGQGEVVLSYGEDFEIKTTKFKSFKKMGGTRFNIVFKDIAGAPEGSMSLFTGSYLRGTNMAVYYGDIYGGVKKPEGFLRKLLDFQGKFFKHKLKYVGGFVFKAEIEQD